MPNDRCNKCHGIWLKNSIKTNFSAGESTEQLAADQPPSNKTALKSQHSVHDPMQYLKEQQEIKSIILTTETAPNLNIKSRVGIIMADADCSFTVKMVENNNALQSKLRSEAHSIGANAVVGITFNMIETYSATLGVSKVNTFKLIAYGTAVIIEDEEDAL
tara:strand:- start:195 stop:677 length:483 start_codon:yes stop_codon:yes gene_type:complete